MSTFAVEEGGAGGPDGAGGGKIFNVGIIRLVYTNFIGIVVRGWYKKGGGRPQPGLENDMVISDPEEKR